MKQKFYICNHCGNIIALIRDCGVPVYCCGEPMHEIVPGTTDASKEKHVPVYEEKDNKIIVTVGEVAHPMTEEHYIEWICLETDQGIQYKKLSPNTTPEAVFSICEADKVKYVYAFCNQHSLWKV